MADVNANIGINIDSSAALAELKALQRQLATFHASIAKNSAAAGAAQKGLQQNLLNSINATGQFHASMGLVRTSTESFTHALENNKLSMREYFRYAGASSKSFGKLFKTEFDTIGKVAEERVRKMQTQYIKMGRDASGAMKAMSVTPSTLNMKDYSNQTAVAAQKQALFNQLVKQGSTSLLNFGKNTQWAGRQLMVGFSVPLMYIGSIASKTFMEMEEQVIKFKRVYGEMFTTEGETEKAVKEIQLLAQSFTKYGVAVTKTMEMAASAAAMGKTGADLTAQVVEATRLAVLGGVEQQQALETTISLTNAFGISADQLANKINFLNAVENQTVVSIEDLTIAIPKAGPVVEQLGGSIEDLAFFLTAMKEGGINASEGANALKSGLAALINPTKKASEMLGALGVNINGIVEANAGNLKGTVVGFAQALDTLDPLNRARAIEQLFGKFQFARLSTLFKNITTDGSQANKVLGLTQATVEELAILSQREMKKVEDAVGTNFKQSLEDLKVSIMPIGKAFLEALTPIVKFAADLLKKFDGLGDGTKKFIVVATTLVGILGPTLLMAFGLVANGAANIIKLFLALRTGFLKLGGNATVLSQQTSYLNAEQLEAATVAASLNQAHTRLTQSFTLETSAVNALRNAYVQATTAAMTFARANPGMMMPGFKGSAPKKFARGATYVPGTGNKDTVPSLLTPGEAVIPRDIAQNPAYQPIIDAMVNGNLQGFNKGTAKVGTIAGTVDFGGKTYKATSQETALSLVSRINENMDKAKLGGYETDAERLIQNRMDDLSTVSNKRPIVKPLEISTVFKHIREGKSTSGGAKANNPAIASARKKLNAANKAEAVLNVDRETAQVVQQLKAAGFTDNQIRDFTVKSEAHILDPKDKSIKWLQGQTVQDYKGLNTYLNRAGGTAVGDLIAKINQNPDAFSALGYTPKENRRLSYDYAFAKSKKHPTSQSEFERITRIADLEERAVRAGLASQDMQDNVHQARGVVALSKARTPKFYKKFYKKVLQLEGKTATPVRRGQVDSLDITKAKDFQALKIFTKADAEIKSGKFKDEPVTEYKKRIQPTTGYSFQEANHLSGIYEKPDKSRVFVKPVMSEAIALAEMRGTEIGRRANNLETPEQTLRVIRDPLTGKKLFALESAYNPNFDPARIPKVFSQQDYFSQLVAANLRGDTDLKKGNLGGNVLTDVGRAGVLDKASGSRKLVMDFPSMEETAEKNLSGVPGKAAGNSPRWFGNATADIARNMTSDAYDKAMKEEIRRVRTELVKVLDTFPLTPEEKPYYQAMVDRLDAGAKVDWKKLHKRHTSIVVKPDELIEDEKGKLTKPKTEPKPAGVKSSSKNAKDTRITPAPKKGKRVVQNPRAPRTKVVLPGFANAPISQNAASGLNQFAMDPSPSEIQRQSDAIKANAGAVEVNTVETNKTTNRIKELGNKGNVAIGALSGLTIAGTFAGGKLGEMANAAMPFVFAAQGVAGVMSMMPKSMTLMQSRMLGVGAAIAVFSVVVKKLNDTYVKAQTNAMDLAEATGASASAMEKFATMAQKASPGQIMDERRKTSGMPLSVQTGKTSFGESFVAAPDNAELIKSMKTSYAAGDAKQAAKDLSDQLSVAVANGVFTPEQARSVAVNIGQSLGNLNIGFQASAKLSELFGADGSNLLKDPLTLRVKLMEDATSKIATDTANLGNAGGLTTRNTNAITGAAVATGAVAGAAAMTTMVAQGAALGTVLGGPVGTALGAVVGSIVAGGIALLAMKNNAEDLGKLSGAAVQNQINALNVNKEMVASVDLYYQNLIKTKYAEGDILGAKIEQDKYDKARAKLAEKTKKTAEQIANAYKNTSGASQEALVEAAKKATNKKYKGTEQEEYVSAAQSSLQAMMPGSNRGKKGKFEYVMTVEMNAGTLKPSDILAITKTFGKDEKSMDKIMRIVTKFGGDKAAQTQQVLGAFVSPDGTPNTKAQTEFLANVSTANTKKADELLSFYGALAQNQGILDVGILVNYYQNNSEAAKALQLQLDAIKQNQGKLSYKVATEFLPPTGDVSLNEEYMKGLNQAQKEIYVRQIAILSNIDITTTINSEPYKKWLSDNGKVGGAQWVKKGLSDPSLVAKFNDSFGQKVTEENINAAFEVKPPANTGSGSGKVRDTTLDELMKKLKFVRDAAINAEGSIKDLVKIVSGDGITKFTGVSQQLMAGSKGGLNREFISMLESMDNKTRNIYMTEKKGIVTLTNKGKALKVAYDEKVIGQYQDAQVKTLQDTIAQQAAFVKLKAAGVDTTTALEMVADANLAVAINAKKITPEELVKMAKAAKAAKNSAAELAMALERVSDAAKNDLTDAFTKLKALTGAKGLGFDTESLKIIADSPELIQSMTELLAGKGSKKALDELKTKIVNMINNIKDLKVVVDVEIGGITGADFLKSQFSDAKNKFDIIAKGLIDNINKEFAPAIQKAEDDIEGFKDQVEGAENTLTAAQEALDKVTKAFDDFSSALEDAISLGVDDLAKALEDLSNLDTAKLAEITKIPDSVLKNLIATTKDMIKAQDEVDKQEKIIKEMTDAKNINMGGLAPYRGVGEAALKDPLKVIGSMAEAERQIAIVQANIEEKFNRPIELAQQYIAGQQRTLEVGYTRVIEDIQKKIEGIQRNIAVNFEIPLKNLQEESSNLSEDLAVMDKAADAVNDKYTKQEEALSKIAEINQDIVDQQKQQLGLADALSKGDISAAAAAVQDMRAANAAKSLGSQEGALGKAREAELAAIKSSSGLTRDQISERQYAIERSSYRIQQLQAIEQQKILDFQERIYKIETDPNRLAILQLIKDKEEEIYNLDLNRTLANNAIYGVQQQISASNLLIGQQQATLASTQATLSTAQEAREKAIRAAEAAHKIYVTELTTALTAAQDALKAANDKLAGAEKALADLITKRDAQIKQITDETDKMDALTASIAAMEAGIDLATLAVGDLETAFADAAAVAQTLIDKLAELKIANQEALNKEKEEVSKRLLEIEAKITESEDKAEKLEAIAEQNKGTDRGAQARDAAKELREYLELLFQVAQKYDEVNLGMTSLAVARQYDKDLLTPKTSPTPTPTPSPTPTPGSNTGGSGGSGGGKTAAQIAAEKAAAQKKAEEQAAADKLASDIKNNVPRYDKNGFSLVPGSAEYASGTTTRSRILDDTIKAIPNGKFVSPFKFVSTKAKDPKTEYGIYDPADSEKKYGDMVVGGQLTKDALGIIARQLWTIPQFSKDKTTFEYLSKKYQMQNGKLVMLAAGGIVPKLFAEGGYGKGTDTIPAMLSPGEFVIKKSAVDSYGVNNLSKINSGMSPDSSVYNYSLSVNVSGNNLNADDIASTVMQKIKYIDGQRVRGQR